jgi:hypothetical protein
MCRSSNCAALCDACVNFETGCCRFENSGASQKLGGMSTMNCLWCRFMLVSIEVAVQTLWKMAELSRPTMTSIASFVAVARVCVQRY